MNSILESTFTTKLTEWSDATKQEAEALKVDDWLISGSLPVKSTEKCVDRASWTASTAGHHEQNINNTQGYDTEYRDS